MKEETEKVEKHHQHAAEGIVDTLFEAGLFRADITRPDMKALEDLLALHIHFNENSIRRSLEWREKMKKWEKRDAGKDKTRSATEESNQQNVTGE